LIFGADDTSKANSSSTHNEDNEDQLEEVKEDNEDQLEEVKEDNIEAAKKQLQSKSKRIGTKQTDSDQKWPAT
jgi:hypothetical protein